MADDTQNSSTGTNSSTVDVSSVRKHHKQDKLSYNRPKYREARWERSVKVYTINLESKYVLVQGIPAVGATKELLELFALYGAIEEYRILDEYPTEPFTEVYWIKFQKINSARIAKKKLDNRSFFGGILHVCYAPEYETVDDTREKLQERRKIIAKKTRDLFGARIKTSTTEAVSAGESSLKRTLQEESKRSLESSSDVHGQQQEVHQTDDYRVPPSGSVHELHSTPYTVSSSSSVDYPILPPPPQRLHPYQYPPPPLPWEFPWVPSAHATLPVYLQNLPPPSPPPPPPPPPPELPVCDTKTSKGPGQEKPFTVYMSQAMIGPQPEDGASSNKPSLTGDNSLDKTAFSIRKRLHQLSRTHQTSQEISPFPAQNMQQALNIVQNPVESSTSTVPKKKRKRI